MKQYLLGTAVKITTILDTDTATCTITIEDPSDSEKVTNASMTKADNKVYYYIWQSSSNYNEGIYTCRITAVSGDYTSIKEEEIEMIDQSDK